MSFLHEQLLNAAQHPLLMAFLVLISTYVLEDAAIVTAALLSADGLINTELAFFALFIGIFTGDLGLYVMGKYLHKIPRLQSLSDISAVHKSRRWLDNKMTTTVLLVRLIPGLRLPVYTACGFFNLSWKLFTLLVFMASLLWTAVVFYGFFSISIMFWAGSGDWKWFLVPVLFGILFLGHKKMNYFERFLH